MLLNTPAQAALTVCSHGQGCVWDLGFAVECFLRLALPDSCWIGPPPGIASPLYYMLGSKKLSTQQHRSAQAHPRAA